MVVIVRFEYDEEFAKVLGDYYGKKRVTRAEVRTWAEGNLISAAQTIQADYDAERKETP